MSTDTDHKQVTISLPNNITFDVDEEMEDIIYRLNFYHFTTSLSCQGSSTTRGFISFESFFDFQNLMQFSLRNHIIGKYKDRNILTLFEFICNLKPELQFIELVMYDPNDEDAVIPTGKLIDTPIIRFNNNELQILKKLVQDVLPIK